jgi:hypothetical protein
MFIILLKLIYYLLFNLILFNNYKVIYLINDKALLKPGLFSKLNKRIIEVRTSNILIISHNIQIIKNVFNNINNLIIKDLILE